MELQIGNIAEMVELGLTWDIVAWGRINAKPNPGSAAGDYIAQYAPEPDCAYQKLADNLQHPGDVFYCVSW